MTTTSEPRFWLLDALPTEDTSADNRLNEVREAAKFDVLGLVDEKDGGVIAYLHSEFANAICQRLNDSQDPENVTEAINNIRQAIRVIAPIWESMARFGHSGAGDVAGAQADLEQAIRFLTGEEEPS